MIRYIKLDEPSYCKGTPVVFGLFWGAAAVAMFAVTALGATVYNLLA